MQSQHGHHEPNRSNSTLVAPCVSDCLRCRSRLHVSSAWRCSAPLILLVQKIMYEDAALRASCTMATAQWNQTQQSSYRGSYQQQTTSYITGNRSRLIRRSTPLALTPLTLRIDMILTRFAAKISSATQSQKDSVYMSSCQKDTSAHTQSAPSESITHPSFVALGIPWKNLESFT